MMREELQDMRQMEEVSTGDLEEQELPEVIEENGLVYQLYFRRGRSVLSRPVPPGRDRVFDWKIWTDPGRVYVGAPST